MKRLIIALVQLITITFFVFATNSCVEKQNKLAESQNKIKTKIKNDTIYKYGFINENGEEITAVKYDTAYSFKNGVARIMLSGKYGLIDETGKEITAIKYDNISSFDHNVACVRINGKWGIIDNKGKEITELQYDYMQNTEPVLVLCLRGGKGMTLLDELDQPIESNTSGYFSDNNSYFNENGIVKVCLNGKWGFMDKTGKAVSKIKYDYVFSYREGMARVLLNNKWGFINEFGTEVIPLVYNFFDDELSYDRHFGIAEENNYSENTYLDVKGNKIQYDTAEFLDQHHTYFIDGLVRVHYSNIHDNYSGAEYYPEYVFLDKKGKEVKSKKYDPVIDSFYDFERTKNGFYHDGLRIKKNNAGTKYGFADMNGTIIIPIKYDFVTDFKDGVAEVGLNRKSGLINKKGQLIAPLKYSSISDFYEGLAIVNINKGYHCFWGAIDNKGKEITPLKYDFIEDFRDGFAMIEYKGKIGFIDKSGKEIIPPKYNNAASFSEGFAEVVYDGKVGFIDKIGKQITLFKYDETQSFSNGFARVRIGNKWSFINKTGKEIIPLKYDAIEDFEEGMAVVKILDK